jgi:hypothetical protein
MMEDRERTNRLSPEIYVYATNKNFLNLYDALRIEKVKVEIAGYDPNSNRQTGLASAWLDVDDVRLLCHLVTQRQFKTVTGGRWEKYGGSQRDDGHIESRVLAIEWDEGEGGRFARYPYRVSIANGPGKRTATGGVAPDGSPTSQMSMRMPELDFIKTMLALGDYVHAYEAAHHHRIVADRMRELKEKLSDRGERHAFEQEREPARMAPRSPQGEQAPATVAASATKGANLQAIPGGARRTGQNQNRDNNEPSRLTPLRARTAV